MGRLELGVPYYLMSLLLLHCLDGLWNWDLTAGRFLSRRGKKKKAQVCSCDWLEVPIVSVWYVSIGRRISQTIKDKKKTHGKRSTYDSIHQVSNQNNSIKRLKSRWLASPCSNSPEANSICRQSIHDGINSTLKLQSFSPSPPTYMSQISGEIQRK